MLIEMLKDVPNDPQAVTRGQRIAQDLRLRLLVK